jgi:hypothetical protein
MNSFHVIGDPSGNSIKLTLAEMLGEMASAAPVAIDPGVVLARLGQEQRLAVALPDAADPLAELIRRLALMRGSTLLDAHGRKYQIRKKASAAGFVFIPKFIDWHSSNSPAVAAGGDYFAGFGRAL